MPYISVNHSLKIDVSAHGFSERFTENRILLLHFQWIHSLPKVSLNPSLKIAFTGICCTQLPVVQLCASPTNPAMHLVQKIPFINLQKSFCGS